MKYCKKCVQPDNRPGIYFNDEGICGACLYQEDVLKNINWDQREKELKEITMWAKQKSKENDSNYDCAIGISGGKDSTFQALYARDRLGLRSLLVNCEPDGITKTGMKNIENLKQLGFDVISIRSNPIVLKKLIKKDFYEYGNPVKVTEFPLFASTFIIADKFNIPLIIQGENPGLTLGVSKTGLGTGDDALNANKGDTLSTGLKRYLSDEVSEKDLFMYRYDEEAIRKKSIRGIWLQYYTKEWSFSGNTEFSIKHGLNKRDDHNPVLTGRINPYCSVDSDMQIVNQLLKFIKFGFGFATDESCYLIREGRITREQGIKLVKEYDGKCGQKYIDEFCSYIGITKDEFWRVADSFRGDMWEKDKNGQWKLREPIWEQELVSDEVNINDILEYHNKL